MLSALLFFSALFLAYSNGANDNFKGVATLYGSQTMGYRAAIGLATIATFLGSVCAIYFAQALVESFSGKGLVPEHIAGEVHFLIATGLGAAMTVLLATRLGFPISTTHSLVGALLGAGLMAVGWQVDFDRLGNTFFIPLLVSPLMALLLGAWVYSLFSMIRKRMGLNKQSCICLGGVRPQTVNQGDGCAFYASDVQLLPPAVQISDDASECVDLYTHKISGVFVQKILDFAHIVSAFAVSFARGLNDTPKIAGLLVAVQGVEIEKGMVALAIGMAIGGLLNAHRLADTMAKKITAINHGQGFSANLVTSLLVIVASKMGVPVSTTHVSVGAIFGIGFVNKRADLALIRNIVLSWVITLPVAMLFSSFLYWGLMGWVQG